MWNCREKMENKWSESIDDEVKEKLYRCDQKRKKNCEDLDGDAK